MNYKGNIAIVLGVCYFCFSVCAALIFQKVLLPMMPSLHAGRGLLINDSVYFDSVASKLAEDINNFGWSNWSLFPANGAPGNVAILGALYALFGHDPTVIIPVNSALHAFSGVLIFLLAFEFTTRANVANWAGAVAATLYVILPSALSWYGQMHKDSYAIAGALLIIYTWSKAVNDFGRKQYWYRLIASNLLGIVLLGIVRPYALKIFLIAAGFLLLLMLLKSIVLKKLKLIDFRFFIVAILMMALGVGLLKNQNMGELYASPVAASSQSAWRWESSIWFPHRFEKYIKIAAETRRGLIEYGVGLNAGSMIDEDIAPKNINEVFGYIPRAIQIATLAPFPSSWTEKPSLTRTIAAGEMVVYYFCIFGLFFLVAYNRAPGIFVALYFCLFFLAIYGFTQANIGTLYRYRYAYTSVLMLLGSIGWFSWLDINGYLEKWVNSPKRAESIEKDCSNDVNLVDLATGRKRTMVSAVVVLGLTFLGFVGFFLRDIFMARAFGINSTLDSFFIGLLVPMFIVTVLWMPLGSAIIPFYLEEREKSLTRAEAFIRSISFWVSVFTGCICVILYLCFPLILPHVYPGLSTDQISEIIGMFVLALPILLFSGVIILANAVLNAHGKTIITSGAQLVVPVATIILLLTFGDSFGAEPVMIGMVVGQIINLVIIHVFLARQGVYILRWPRVLGCPLFVPLVKQYLPLAASAFFINIAITASSLIAITLPFGSVSAFNLGNKVVLFVTGMVNAVVSTVILPYFSALIIKNNLLSARKELSYFLILVTFISVPFSSLLYVFSENIVSFIFQKGVYESGGGKAIVAVMRYAVVQMPFFVCNAVLLKFAIATRHGTAVFMAAVLGLIVNVVATLSLVNAMGVAGVSFGLSIAVLFSTLMLFIVMFRYGHINLFDLVVIVLNWMMFITLLIAVHFYSVPSILVIAAAYFLLAAMYYFMVSISGLDFFYSEYCS